MRRRTFLAATTVALAGCSGRSDSESAGDSEPSLTVTDLSAPDTVEIDTTFQLQVTVKNDGDAEGTYESPISAKLGVNEWASIDQSVQIAVPGGESVTEGYELGPYEYVRPASFRLDESDTVVRNQFVTRTPDYGEAYTTPGGVVLTVVDLTFTDTYAYEGSDGTEEVSANDGQKWAIATVRTENPTDESVEPPQVDKIDVMRDEDQEFGYTHLGDNRDLYDHSELEPGAVREGEIPATVPEAAGKADLRVEYDEELADGDIAVYWAAPSYER